MECLCDLYQHADWKNEKHIPIIDVPDTVVAGEDCKVSVCIGKEIPHPNKTEHHIIGRVEFSAHGESPEGPDSSGVYTHHCAAFCFKTDKPGTICAGSYCNVHGLWESCRELKIK